MYKLSGTLLQNFTNILPQRRRLSWTIKGEGPRDRGYDRDWGATAGSHFPPASPNTQVPPRASPTPSSQHPSMPPDLPIYGTDIRFQLCTFKHIRNTSDWHLQIHFLDISISISQYFPSNPIPFPTHCVENKTVDYWNIWVHSIWKDFDKGNKQTEVIGFIWWTTKKTPLNSWWGDFF